MIVARHTLGSIDLKDISDPDGIDEKEHQCKNAHLCYKHPELELDWIFLETIRLKRNAINYRGQLLNYEDWTSFKLKFDLHIRALQQELDKKLKE